MYLTKKHGNSAYTFKYFGAQVEYSEIITDSFLNKHHILQPFSFVAFLS